MKIEAKARLQLTASPAPWALKIIDLAKSVGVDLHGGEVNTLGKEHVKNLYQALNTKAKWLEMDDDPKRGRCTFYDDNENGIILDFDKATATWM